MKQNERVLNKDFKKVYDRKEVKKWIDFGVQNQYVNLNDKNHIKDWIKLLGQKNFHQECVHMVFNTPKNLKIST